jgi:starch-binding outer membrane protein, SusD/RagB family
MKFLKYITAFVFGFSLVSCDKVIDLEPQSNLNTTTYYANTNEVKAGLVGCYNGLQKPMYTEWQLTELRSDNSKQGSTGSQNTFNRELSDLDMFFPSPLNQSGVYPYWSSVYSNIYNANIVLEKLGVVYDLSSGSITLKDIKSVISEADRKQFAGEALFIRAYHYFNLVRLFGGVFLVHTPIRPETAKTMSRASVADMYKFIEADLKTAITYMNPAKFSQITGDNIGRANQWAAKALLGKMYLTLNKKAEAITFFQDVITNSGFSLLPNYADVFSITNEMNAEILFTVRYKAGGFGLGSTFGNDFAPISTGTAVINGDGGGWDAPTIDVDSAFAAADKRRVVNLATYVPAAKTYVKKYLFPVVISNDGESDWPIIRFADVLLMMAEAKGYTPEGIALINQTRTRAGLPVLAATVNTVAAYELALSTERRLELAFENHRFLDLARFGTTLTTINGLQVMKNHFAKEFAKHYAKYPAPTLTLLQLQDNANADRFLLPIPQHELDTNPGKIEQNPSY